MNKLFIGREKELRQLKEYNRNKRGEANTCSDNSNAIENFIRSRGNTSFTDIS